MLPDAPGIYFSVGIGDVKRLMRTPSGVALPFGEWAKQRGSSSASNIIDEGQFLLRPGETLGSGLSGPSLQDTITWMRNFSQEHGLILDNGKLISKVVLVPDPIHQKTSAPGCAVRVMIDSSQAKKGSSTAVVRFLDLSDINPESVKVVKVVEGSYVDFETADVSEKIHDIWSVDPMMTSAKLVPLEGQANVIEGFTAEGTISLDSPESDQRFANALKYAVTLCGGAKSPF
jgi:hypothetical protein